MTSRKVLEDLIRSRKCPEASQKYQVQQATEWYQISHLSSKCTDFDITKRAKTIQMVCSFMSDDNKVPCEVKNLPLSQITALEQADKAVAEKVANGDVLNKTLLVPDDGSNACGFLALKICSELADLGKSGKIMDKDIILSIGDIAVNVIKEYPLEVNKLCDKKKLYTPIDAYSLVKAKHHLPNIDGLSEELPYNEGVFDKVSRDRLLCKLLELCTKPDDFFSIFTCEPYSLIIGSLSRRMLILDTHPITEELGGNGNAQLRFYETVSKESCKAVCHWLWQRLAKSSVKNVTGQSLALLNIVQTKGSSQQMPDNSTGESFIQSMVSFSIYMVGLCKACGSTYCQLSVL